MVSLTKLGRPEMTQAEVLVEYAHSKLGCRYVMGTEGPTTFDCSGLVCASYRAADIRWVARGAVFPRLTANDYYIASKPVDVDDLRIGDMGFMVGRSGRAYHVVLYVGDDCTIEARGRNWGVVKYHLKDPAGGVLWRGAVFRRFPWVELGDDMTKDQDKLLRQIRLSTVASSCEAEIQRALLKELIRAAGGDPTVADALEASKAARVSEERARLGL